MLTSGRGSTSVQHQMVVMGLPGWLTMVGLRADSTEPPTMPPTSTEMKPHRKKMPKIWRSRPDSEGFLHRYCTAAALVRLLSRHSSSAMHIC